MKINKEAFAIIDSHMDHLLRLHEPIFILNKLFKSESIQIGSNNVWYRTFPNSAQGGGVEEAGTSFDGTYETFQQ